MARKLTAAELAEWLRNLTWPTMRREQQETPKVRAAANLLEEQAAEIARLRERVSYMGAVCESVHEISEAALKGE